MNRDKCCVCGGELKNIFRKIVLGQYEIDYYQCKKCGLIQTEKPYWLKEAYKNPINIFDTGLLKRNINFSKFLTIFLQLIGKHHGPLLDYAGGYGVLTRLLRDNGYDCYWYDPYTSNVFAKKFEGRLDKKYSVVIAQELFEHLEDPKQVLNKIFQFTDVLIITTNLIPQDQQDIEKWWYFGFKHGQHITLYTKKALLELANYKNLHLLSHKNIHIFSKQKISKFFLLISLLVTKLDLMSLFKRKSFTFQDSGL
jgi:hypothetical protein